MLSFLFIHLFSFSSSLFQSSEVDAQSKSFEKVLTFDYLHIQLCYILYFFIKGGSYVLRFPLMSHQDSLVLQCDTESSFSGK